MALVAQGIVEVTVPMVDESGSRTQFQANFAYVPATIPALITGVVALIPLLEAVSGAGATGLTISVPFREDDAPAPDPDSRVERRARLDYVTVNGRRGAVTIPAVDPTLVDAQGYLDTGPTSPAGLLAAALVALPWTDSRGEEIADVIDAREIFRGSTASSRPRLRATT